MSLPPSNVQNLNKFLTNCSFHTDPPGIQMDICVTKPGAKTPRYITARGSSQLEDFHPLLHATITASNTGVKLANCLMRELRYRVNIDRCVANRGDLDLCTYEHWRIELIKVLSQALGIPGPYSEWALTPANFVCYETFGISEGFDLTPFTARVEAAAEVVDCSEQEHMGEDVPAFASGLG
jgi:hypothetical protein